MSDKKPTPELFFDTVNAHIRTEAIKSAIELEVFTRIAEGKQTAAEIARTVHAAERGVRILCDYLVIMGFLVKKNGKYELTPESALFLDGRSPAYLGGAIDFLLSPMLTDGFKNLTAAVRKGGTVMSEHGTVEPDHPIWVKFAKAMAAMSAPQAEAIARLVDPDADQPLKVLDIAAGHGSYGINFATRNPNAEVIALDWPAVLEVAVENAKRAGVADRYSTIGGSAFEADFGRGYDVVLLTNFLHHFDAATIEGVLSKVHTCLAEDGRAVTLEFIPDEDRVTPQTAAGFAMVMLGSTAAGDAYTFKEYEAMFVRAGFSRNELHELPNSFQRVVISYR